MLKSLVGSRLSISPCVVVDTDTTIGTVGHIWWQRLIDQAERIVAAVDSNSGPGSARVDNILTTSSPGSSPQVHFRKFLLKAPSVYSDTCCGTQPSTKDDLRAMNDEFCEVVGRKGSALHTEICPLILWAVPALLRNDPLVPLNLLVRVSRLPYRQ